MPTALRQSATDIIGTFFGGEAPADMHLFVRRGRITHVTGGPNCFRVRDRIWIDWPEVEAETL